MVYAGWKLVLVVGDHDEGLVGALAEGIDDVLDQSAIGEVKTMERLIEDEELGILDEGTGKEDKTLLTTGESKERVVGKMSDAKDVEPETADAVLGLVGAYIESNTVLKA